MSEADIPESAAAQGLRAILDLLMLAGLAWLLWFGLEQQRLPLPNGAFLERQEAAAGYWGYVALIAVVLLLSARRALSRLQPAGA